MAKKFKISFEAEDNATPVIKGIRSNLTKLAELSDIGGFASDALGGIANVAKDAFVSSAGAAIDLEQQLANIASISKSAAENMDGLDKLISDLGLDPNLKVSATEAADVIEILSRNGADAQDIIDGMAKSTIALSNATGADFVTAGDVATDVMAAWGIKASEMSVAADGVAAVLSNSKFDVNDYALALSNGGVALSNFGVSLDDFNTVIAGTASSFSGGQTAGTAWRTMIQRLVPTTKPAREAMAELGLLAEDGANAFFDSAGQLKSMDKVIGLLEGSFSSLTDEQRQTYAAAIFGQEALPALFGAINLGAEGFNNLKSAMQEVSAEDAVAIRMDTTAGSLEIMNGVIEASRKAMGDKMKPAIKSFAEAMTAFVGNGGLGSGVSDAITLVSNSLKVMFDTIKIIIEGGSLDQLKDGIANVLSSLGIASPKAQAFADALVAGGTKVKEFLGYISKLPIVIYAIDHALAIVGATLLIVFGPTVISAIAGVAAALAPILAPILAISAALFGLKLAWDTNFLGIQDRVYAFAETVASTFSSVRTWLSEAVPAAILTVILAVNSMSETIGQAVGDIQAWFSEKMSAGILTFILAIDFVRQKIVEFSEIAVASFGSFMAFLAPKIEAIIQFFQVAIPMAIDFLAQAFSGVGSILVMVLSEVWGIVTTLGSALLEIASILFSDFPASAAATSEAISGVGAFFDGLGAILRPILRLLGSVTRFLINSIPEGVALIKAAFSGSSGMFDGFVEGFGNALDVISDFLDEAGSIGGALEIAFAALDEAGFIDSFQSTIAGVKEEWNAWMQAFADAGAAIAPAIEALSPLKDLIVSAFSGAWDAIVKLDAYLAGFSFGNSEQSAMSFRDTMVSVAEWIGTNVPAAVENLKAVWEWLSNAGSVVAADFAKLSGAFFPMIESFQRTGELLNGVIIGGLLLAVVTLENFIAASKEKVAEFASLFTGFSISISSEKFFESMDTIKEAVANFKIPLEINTEKIAESFETAKGYVTNFAATWSVFREFMTPDEPFITIDVSAFDTYEERMQLLKDSWEGVKTFFSESLTFSIDTTSMNALGATLATGGLGTFLSSLSMAGPAIQSLTGENGLPKLTASIASLGTFITKSIDNSLAFFAGFTSLSESMTIIAGVLDNVVAGFGEFLPQGVVDALETASSALGGMASGLDQIKSALDSISWDSFTSGVKGAVAEGWAYISRSPSPMSKGLNQIKGELTDLARMDFSKSIPGLSATSEQIVSGDIGLDAVARPSEDQNLIAAIDRLTAALLSQNVTGTVEPTRESENQINLDGKKISDGVSEILGSKANSLKSTRPRARL